MAKLTKTAAIVEYYNSLIEEDSELERQISELQSARSELQIELKGIRRRLGLNGSSGAIMVEMGQSAPNITRPAENRTPDVEPLRQKPKSADGSIPIINVKGKTRRDAAVTVIRETGEWLSAKSLVEYMDKGGLDMSSPSATISLYPVLNKTPELQYVTGDDGVKVYGLREWQPIKSHRKSSSRKRRHRGGVTIGNVVEEFLRVVKQANLDKLMDLMENKGFEVSRKNLRDTLSRDAHRRFNNMNGIWTLSQSAQVSQMSMEQLNME